MQVKIGVQGAEEFGEYEEWFNYRMARAAPETCAEFLGSFVADKTNTQFTKGGKWLVWKFEVLYLVGNSISTSNTDMKALIHKSLLSANELAFGGKPPFPS